MKNRKARQNTMSNLPVVSRDTRKLHATDDGCRRGGDCHSEHAATGHAFAAPAPAPTAAATRPLSSAASSAPAQRTAAPREAACSALCQAVARGQDCVRHDSGTSTAARRRRSDAAWPCLGGDLDPADRHCPGPANHQYFGPVHSRCCPEQSRRWRCQAGEWRQDLYQRLVRRDAPECRRARRWPVL